MDKNSNNDQDSYDMVVVGGGINGCGIARDAAGRGLKVLLCEKGDLAEGTSSRSGKYIHGGLRYLEYFEFRLVREALIEREVILQMAPHLTWPMRLILPHSPEQRPRWLIRLGLFLYDHLGGRKKLPATRALNLTKCAEGDVIRPEYKAAFEYSDVWVDDSRLVILNAVDAAKRGADILTRTRCIGAKRNVDSWVVELKNERTSEVRKVLAKSIINAAGPWVEKVLTGAQEVRSTRRVRLVKGSHLIMRRWWNGGHGYVLQNSDKRLIFVNPYFDDLALVGTTDVPYDDTPEDVRISDSEIDYLLEVLNRYFRTTLSRADIVSSYSGVRPLYDDDADKSASAVTRDYTFELDVNENAAPYLSVFGGKLTTYRKLSEHALEKIAPYFTSMGNPWTANVPLPGGDIDGDSFADWVKRFISNHSWLPHDLALYYARAYGTDAYKLLDGINSKNSLGTYFGAQLYALEANWCIRHEWAESSDDILYRRTKHGIFMTDEQRSEFDTWLQKNAMQQDL